MPELFRQVLSIAISAYNFQTALTFDNPRGFAIRKYTLVKEYDL